MCFTYTAKEAKKISDQLKGIANSIEFMKFHRDRLKKAIFNFIPENAAKVQDFEKDIDIDFSTIPSEFIDAIKSTGLHKRIHRFYNLRFQVDLIITKEIGHFISDMYNTINHLFNLIVFAHPTHVFKKQLSDTLQSMSKNKAILQGNLSTIITDNQTWISEFKENRKLDEHKSPIEFYIFFRIRPENSKASFVLTNNFSSDELDLFELFGTLDKLDMFSNSICAEIKSILNAHQ